MHFKKPLGNECLVFHIFRGIEQHGELKNMDFLDSYI